MSVLAPISIPRSSILPLEIEAFGRLGGLTEWYIWLWQQAPLELNAGDIDLLRVYTSLIIDSAIPHATALDCLSSLFRPQAAEPYLSVTIPISRTDRTLREIELGLNDMTSLAIHCWQGREPDPQLELDMRPHQLFRELDSTLKSNFAKTLTVWRGNTAIEFRDIQSLGPLIAIRNGAEPYMLSALNSKTKPTGQSRTDSYFLADVTRESLSHMLQQRTNLRFPSQAMCIDNKQALLSIEEPPPGWIGESRKLLRQLCRELADAYTGRLRTPRQREAAMGIIGRYKRRARLIAPSDSALVLALEYVIHRYVENPTISAGSLRDYLDRAVINGLLDSEASFSLSDWDTDDFVENIEDRISESRLSANSCGQVLDAYAPLLKFLRKKLNLPPISISGLHEDYVTGSVQWAVISPHAIDKVIRSLFEHGQYEYRQAAIVIAFAYYGGLRASEARRLTLANVVFNDYLENLDIELLRGKTANSRRRLPMANLAPPHITRMICDYCNDRRSQFSKSARLSKIALFGADQKREPYSHQSITRLARQLLKQVFGDSSTLHILRHCFCTYLFLRWYAIRHPNILGGLRDRSHAIFQPEMQSRLNSYFACMPLEDGEIRPYDLVSMTKLTGHASPETLFQYYIHSFSLTQSHAVRRINSPVSDIAITDALLKALVPRMKSPSSRVGFTRRQLSVLTERSLTRVQHDVWRH
ncbi:MAG: site-specific integrase [Candidatus Thiodiazotropha sp. (ex Lucinoma borealis)]|nr:site-specific integrase [Candidatus Thiodiazotropha sp. (ex Lucinoma borealis)]